MKKKQDWQFIGRFVGTLVQLFTIISGIFKKAGVGFEVIEWLVDEGREFLKDKLTEIVGEYKRHSPKLGAAQVPEIKPAKILHLDPSKKFDPAAFIGAGWTVWKGSAGGNGLEGDEDIDSRPLAFTTVDLSAALFEHSLKGNETSIKGEEKLKRLIEDSNIRFGGNVFLALWEDHQQNKENSCLEWLRKNRNITWLSFFGLVLRHPGGGRYVLCLCFHGAEWSWGYYWLGRGWDASSLSAGSRK